ncbi:hypothetical protein CAXC1_300018 [Candidatus Xenohaliotis californiensis]|uniref:Uncharacterized protein n=1 Tax=Candidatus Xenohaliotis californiensis TaxID=84677 RepID=A0ABP0EV90_9RICK|nr:hypothetical protein CAXC1_300018 [Candidatus Xenohaliotis californiensis]
MMKWCWLLFLLFIYNLKGYTAVEVLYNFEYGFVAKGLVNFLLEDESDHGYISMEIIPEKSLFKINPIIGNTKCTTRWHRTNSNYLPDSHICNIGNINNTKVLYSNGHITDLIIGDINLSNNSKNFSVFGNSYDFLYAMISMAKLVNIAMEIPGWQVLSANGVNFYDCTYTNNTRKNVACSCSKILDQISRNIVREDCGNLLVKFADELMPQEISWKFSWSSGIMHIVK